MPKLSPEEISAALTELAGWNLEGGALEWHRVFKSFPEAFAFATRVALLAEKHDHHPGISLDYTKLTLRLVSHDAGGITTRDVGFAHAVNSL